MADSARYQSICLNPGQVFACLGILEMTDVLLGDALAAFDWNNGQETTFRVSAAGTKPPVARVMRFLEEARIVYTCAGRLDQPRRLEGELGRFPGIGRSRRRRFRSPIRIRPQRYRLCCVMKLATRSRSTTGAMRLVATTSSSGRVRQAIRALQSCAMPS